VNDGPHPPQIVERLLGRLLARSPYGRGHRRRSSRSLRLIGWEPFCEVRALVVSGPGISTGSVWRVPPARTTALRLQRTSTRGAHMDRLSMDVRFAMRSLTKRPMDDDGDCDDAGDGVGANAAIFGVIDALLLRPFTARDADRIVMPVGTVTEPAAETRDRLAGRLSRLAARGKPRRDRAPGGVPVVGRQSRRTR